MLTCRDERGLQRDALADYKTAAPVFMDMVHHMIHAGKTFIATHYDADTDIAGPLYLRFTAPTTKEAHLTFEVNADGAGTVEFFETPTEDDPAVPGDAVSAINPHRGSSNTAEATVKSDPVFTADGTLLWRERVGVAGNPAQSEGGSGGSRHEFIVEDGTVYALKFTADADNTKVWVAFNWYEIDE